MNPRTDLFVTRRCPECGHEVEQLRADTAPTFCTCTEAGPQMLELPVVEIPIEANQ